MTELTKSSTPASVFKYSLRARLPVLAAFLLCSVLIAGCGDSDGTHEGEHGTEEGEHVLESSQLLLFTERTELFIEYSPLITGVASDWLIHLTQLSDGKPAPVDKVTVHMKFSQGSTADARAQKQRAGIYKVSLPVPASGSVSVLILMETKGVIDSVLAEALPAYASEEDAHHAGEIDLPDGIAFTRERAWNMDFLVEPVRHRTFPTVVKTTGHLLAHPDYEAELPATAGGVLSYRAASLVPGQQVRKGEVLATISGAGMSTDNLESRIVDAEAALEKARADHERARLLYADNIISKKNLLESTLRFEQTSNALRTLKADVGSEGKSLRAPLSGYVKQIRVPNGAYVREGDPVLTIARNDRILLKAEIYQSDYRLLASIHGASFRTAEGRVYDIRDLNGRLRTRGMAVDASAYSVPVYFEIDGSDFIPGEFVDVYLHAGEDVPRLTIPVSALIEDLGKFYVFVQRGGERFERREIVIGIGDGNVVPVISGLDKTERVVTRGVHAVRLAASAGQVQAHAHAH